MSNWTRIDSEQDFNNHLHNLEQIYQHRFNNYGKPDKYPCMTAYHIVDNQTGWDYCYHFFIYQKIFKDAEFDQEFDVFMIEEGDEF